MNKVAIPIPQLMNVAELAARRAGRTSFNLLTAERTIDVKGFRDIVTDADLAAQDIIVKTIRAHFPEHGFLTEEDDPTLPTNGNVVWIIDPIDGTTNYSRQLPLFCVSVAAVTVDRDGVVQPIAAAVYDPLREELFSAGLGHQASLNGLQMGVSPTSSVADAVFAIDFGHTDTARQTSLRQTSHLADEVMTIRAFGSAVLALAWVAAGRLDAYVNNSLKPWDLAAGQLLIEEAGGLVTMLDGRELQLNQADYPSLGSNKALHRLLLQTLGA